MELYLNFICLLLFILLLLGSFKHILPNLVLRKLKYNPDEGGLSYSREKTSVIKGIAILGIFISHIATHSSLDTGNMGIVIRVLFYSIVSLGDIGVAVFFFLSGYGNQYSLKSRDRNGCCSWFIKRIKKIVVVFLVCYFLTVIVDILLLKAEITFDELIKNLFTLTMPGTVTWYLKIQMLFYVMTFVGCIFFNKNYVPIILLICSTVYSFFMYKLGYGAFWWHTALCYPLGYSFATLEKSIKCKISKYPIKNIIILGLFFVIVFFMFGEFIWGGIWIIRLCCISIMTIAIMVIVYVIDLRQNFFVKMSMVLGKVSFELYLVHAGIVTYCLGKGVSVVSLFEFIALSAILVTLISKLDEKILG